MEVLGLPLEQFLFLAVMILGALFVILLVLRFVAKVGQTIFKIGCAILILAFLLFGVILTWAALTGF